MVKPARKDAPFPSRSGESPRLAFVGSGAFGVPALRALVRAGHAPQLVISQPDRPAGRKRRLTPQPLAGAAAELGFEVWKPERINRPEARARLSELAPDLLIVVAYGQILRRKVLEIPAQGAWNIHGSLLPRHRGASPVQAAILAGDEISGVTIMQMDEGLDTGPALLSRETPVGPLETAGELHDRLAALGGELIVESMERFTRGAIEAEPQDDSWATHCGLIAKADGVLDWERPADEIARRVRAMTPWPGAVATAPVRERQVPVMLHRARAVEGTGAPGETLRADAGGLVVATGQGALEILELQRPGKRVMGAEQFQRGQPIAAGARWGRAP